MSSKILSVQSKINLDGVFNPGYPLENLFLSAIKDTRQYKNLHVLYLILAVAFINHPPPVDLRQFRSFRQK